LLWPLVIGLAAAHTAGSPAAALPLVLPGTLLLLIDFGIIVADAVLVRR